jgi:hypothetical protein
MGTHFFKAPKVGPSNMNLESRAMGSAAYAGRGDAVGAQKDLGAANGFLKAVKQTKGSSAYPKGPKV